MRVLCAVPCLNEEVAIGSVVLRARQHVAEVVVVDDGSSDRTAEVARLAGATAIRHEANRGKGGAYATLWRHAREHGFDALVVLDGDGQHDADEIPLLLAKLAEGHDVVIGARWGETTQMPVWRRVGKRVLDHATALGSDTRHSRPRVTDSQSGFRAYGPKALSSIEPRQDGFAVESQLLMDAHQHNLSIGETRIHCRYDVDGSTLRPIAHAGSVINELLTQVGIRRPLMFMALPGTLALLVGVAAGAYALYLYEAAQVFAMGWVLLAMLLITLGVLAVFMGILFNLLPRSVAEAVRKALAAHRPT